MKLNDGCYFVALGGTEQIGMNLGLFGVIKDGNEEWIIIDVGISMIKHLGIEVIFASVDWAIKKNITAIVITHAHADHKDALPYVLPLLKTNPPIYATKFSCYLIREQLKEHNIEANLVEVPLNGSFTIGMFAVQYIYITHSIPEPNMILLTYLPFNLKLVHTGDWKLDQNPIIGEITNELELLQLGNNGIDVLLCDSTNSLEIDPTGNEGDTVPVLKKIIKDHPKNRVILSLFASNIARLKTILDLAKMFNRKVVLLGRSLVKFFNAAVHCGYLKHEAFIISHEMLHKFNPENLIVICTGSQGEIGAVLHKLASGNHRYIKMHKDDVVVFSSKIIPGNENSINNLKEVFVRFGIMVIDVTSHDDVHVSGHPGQSEIKQLLNLLKPKLVIPVHGGIIQIKGLEDFAKKLGYNVLTTFNGALIDLEKSEIVKTVPTHIIGVDGKQLVPMQSIQLELRKKMGNHGVVFISIHKKSMRITISSYGVLDNSMLAVYHKEIYHMVHNIIKIKKVESFSKTLSIRAVTPKENLQKNISTQISSMSFNNYGKSPLVSVHLMDRIVKES